MNKFLQNVTMPGMPIDASTHGWRVDGLIYLIHGLMFVLFVGWGLFYLYTLYRFRKSRNPNADYHGVHNHASSYLEVAVAAIEAILLIAISVPFWSSQIEASESVTKDAVRMRVIAEQFAWNIHYPGEDGTFGKSVDPRDVIAKGKNQAMTFYKDNPIGLDTSDQHAKDDITTVNQLHIPINKSIIVELSSKDVIHSFFLPVMRIKQDTIPGMRIPQHFIATKPSYEFTKIKVLDFDRPNRDDLTQPAIITVDKSQIEKLADRDILTFKIGDTEVDANVIGVDLENAQIHVTTVRDLDSNTIISKIAYRWEIACAQLCGNSHYTMNGDLIVHPKGEFEKWLAVKSAEQLEADNEW